MSDGKAEYDPLTQKCLDLARAELNVLLIGRHGVGKTTVVKRVAALMGLKMKYYSASTLDPWADLVGIPVPVEGRGLVFHRPRDVDEAELIFFDELNRSHPKVQNACMEIIQFKSINGEPLPSLKMVWAAINPPDDVYEVHELDPALTDRFHAQLEFPYRPSLDYFQSVFSSDVATALVTWWMDELSEEQKKTISPRRLEYLGLLHTKRLPLKDGIPHGVLVPVNLLERRLDQERVITVQDFVERPQDYAALIRTNLNIATRFVAMLNVMKGAELFAVRSLILELPPDLMVQVRRNKSIFNQLYDIIKKREGRGKADQFRQVMDGLVETDVKE